MGGAVADELYLRDAGDHLEVLMEDGLCGRFGSCCFHGRMTRANACDGQNGLLTIPG